MQSHVLKQDHFKKFNNILYKFIKNRHFRAAKAPKRIKREIMCTQLRLRNFGMLDLFKLDAAIKSFVKLYDEKHPLLRMIRERCDYQNYFLVC